MRQLFKRTSRAIYQSKDYQSTLVVEDHGDFIFIKKDNPMTGEAMELQITTRGDAQLLLSILDDILNPKAEAVGE